MTAKKTAKKSKPADKWTSTRQGDRKRKLTMVTLSVEARALLTRLADTYCGGNKSAVVEKLVMAASNYK